MTDLYIPIAQIILAIAMLAVAVLCIRLDRKITALREGKDGVAAAAKELALAVGRAEASVAGLRAVSEAAGEDLQRGIEEARAAAEALKFLVTTARAVDMKPAPAPEPAPARQKHNLRWDEEEVEEDFRLTRRGRPLAETWGGLR
jgi:hypothetical protein